MIRVALLLAAIALVTLAGYRAFETLESPSNTVLGSAFEHGSPQRREVALTFDDGPNPPYTERILDVLRAERVHATFFVVGRAVVAHPQTIRAIAEEGSALGIHGWAHDHMELETDAALLADVDRTAAAIARACEAACAKESEPKIVRPPFGHRGLTTFATLRGHGYTPVLWSIPLSEDWTQPGVSTIVTRSIANVANGSIIVLHDGDRGRTCAPADPTCAREQEAPATRAIVERLRARGFTFATIPQMLSEALNSRK